MEKKKPAFAANLSWLFQEWAFLDRFGAAADAGFRSVEYLFPYEFSPEAIARKLQTHELEQVMFNLAPGSGSERGLASLAGRQAEFRASVATALTYAQATGARRLHVMAGIPGGDPAIALQIYKDSLRFACEAAAPRGITILIEPINARDIPGYLMNSFDLAAQIIAELKLPNLRLQFDIYHRQIIHGDVIRGLEALMPIIGHMQVASVPLRQEPMTGELDDARIFRTIASLGYDGFIGCEYRPAAGTVAGLGWMSRLGD